jgi:hypothetical protein
MKTQCWIFSFIVVLSLGCASDADKQSLDLSSNVDDFTTGTHGWVHGFSDFPATAEDSVRFALKYEYKDVGGRGKAITLSGNNENKDLFFFIKKQLTGLPANANFTITFEVDVICESKNAIYNSVGQNIYLKAGASPTEPKSVIDAGNFEMNIDKGSINEESGVDMMAIGNLVTSPNGLEYVAITRTNTFTDMPFQAKSNSKGELWLIVGADSDYQGLCGVNFSKVSAVLTYSY